MRRFDMKNVQLIFLIVFIQVFNSIAAPIHHAIRQNNISKVKQYLEESPYMLHEKTQKGFSPLHLAVLVGNIEIVKILEEKGADVNLKNNNGGTPLFYACRKGDKVVADYLIKKGASVNIANHNGVTPLHFACKSGNLELIKLLEAHGVNFNVMDCTKGNALHYACLGGSVDVVKFLYQKGFNLETTNAYAHAPIHIAVRCGCREIVEYLISMKVDINSKADDGTTPLHLASLMQYDKIIELLIKNNAKIDIEDSYKTTPLFDSCHYRNTTALNTLIKNKANIFHKDINEQDPLFCACEEGHLNAVKVLTENGACADIEDNEQINLLLLACKNNHYNIFRFLVEKDPLLISKPIPHTTLLHEACYHDNPKFIQFILDKVNVDINALNEGELTPLLIAARCGNFNVVKLLVKHKANVCAKGVYGFQPIQAACFNKKLDVLKFFMEKGASCFVLDEDENSLLHIACSEGNIPVAEFLITQGINVGAKNNKGKTPLHIACEIGDKKMVKLLIDKKADLSEDFYSQSPLQLAFANKRIKLVHWIMKHVVNFANIKLFSLDTIMNEEWTNRQRGKFLCLQIGLKHKNNQNRSAHKDIDFVEKLAMYLSRKKIVMNPKRLKPKSEDGSQFEHKDILVNVLNRLMYAQFKKLYLFNAMRKSTEKERFVCEAVFKKFPEDIFAERYNKNFKITNEQELFSENLLSLCDFIKQRNAYTYSKQLGDMQIFFKNIE